MFDMTRNDVAWAVALLLVVSGASVGMDVEPARQQLGTEEVFVSEHVFRTVDEEAGVVCYVGTLREGAGISCLPDGPSTIDVQGPPVTIYRPNGTYELGSRVTVAGSAPPDAGSVALFARDDGDWELLDMNEDGRYSDADAVPVSPDGRWRRSEVVLTNASAVLRQPGSYQLGAVVAAGVLAPNGSLQARLPPGTLADGPASATVPLEVVPPVRSESLVFADYDGQVAVEDGEVAVSGRAPGAQEVLVLAVDRRGEFASDTPSVARDDTFDEDVPLVAPDGRRLSEGSVVGVVLSAGRDGRVGNGIVDDEFGAGLDALERYLRDRRAAVSLSQAQVLEIMAAESVDEAGSDDLSIVDTFTFTDARTTIDAVFPAGVGNRTGIRPVPVGETMVVRGRTNRIPGDNTVLVDLVSVESGERVSLGQTDEWGQRGVWQVSIPTDGLDAGSYLVEATDGDDADLVRVTLRGVSGNRSATRPR